MPVASPGRGVRVRVLDGGQGISVRVLVQVAELAADDIGQRMRQGVEDRGGLQVAGPGGLECALALLEGQHFAEVMDENPRQRRLA